MKKKNLSISNQVMAPVLCVIGVLALIVTLFYIRPGLIEERDQLQSANEELKIQVAKVNELVQNEQSYAEQSVSYEALSQEILDRYPSEVREEDAILYARELENESDYWITLAGITPETLLYATGTSGGTDGTADTSGTEADSTQMAETVDTAETDSSSGYDLGILDESSVVVPNYQLYTMTASYDFTCSYEDMKKMTEKIFADPDRRNISSISLTRDEESGELIGTMNLNLYYLAGTEKEYETPDAGSMKKGKDNLFGTIKSTKTKKKK